jgi:hypothetical protein
MNGEFESNELANQIQPNNIQSVCLKFAGALFAKVNALSLVEQK